MIYKGIGLIVDFSGVRDGRCVKFWSDWWVDEKALNDKFPRLHYISISPFSEHLSVFVTRLDVFMHNFFRGGATTVGKLLG